MEFQEYRSKHHLLRGGIDRYSIFRTGADFPGMPFERCLPDGFVKLFFYFSEVGNPLYTDSSHKVIDWKDGVGGHPNAGDCYIALPPGRNTFLWVTFRPVFFYQLFAIPIAHLNNNVTQLECLLGEEGKMLKERLVNTECDGQKITLLDQFFLQKWDKSKLFQPDARHLSHLIHTSHGQLDIGTLAKRERVSVRTLQRKFLEEVGLSPKYYAKIVRFNHVTNIIKSATQAMSWHDVVNLCGYFDQAHFIHDVKSLTGQPPSVFYSNQHLISDFHLGR